MSRDVCAFVILLVGVCRKGIIYFVQPIGPGLGERERCTSSARVLSSMSLPQERSWGLINLEQPNEKAAPLSFPIYALAPLTAST